LVATTLENLKIEDDTNVSCIGIPIRILHLLACPKCKKDLMLKQGQVVENKIISGELTCTCGAIYKIENGILVVDATYMDLEYVTDKNMRVEYYETTSKEYIDKIYSSAKWMENVMHMNSESTSDDLFIFEPGIGSGYALAQSLKVIPAGSIYFAVDYNMVRLNEVKAYMEHCDLPFDLVLVGADFLNIPLKEGVVDVVMDMSGSSNRAFSSDIFLLDELNKFFKASIELYGMYIMAEGIDSKELPYERHALFNTGVVKNKIESLGIEIIADFETGKVSTGGPYESFIDMLESTWTYCCYGKREKKKSKIEK